MSTQPLPAPPETLEQKIEQAASEAAQIASIFSPAVGAAITSGVAIEPVVFGFLNLIIGLFKHHAKSAAGGSVAGTPTGGTTPTA